MEAITNEQYRDLPDNIKQYYHNGSDEVLEQFPDTKATGTGKVYQRKDKYDGANSWEVPGKKEAPSGHNDSGSAARFFYCAKVNKKERNFGLDGELPKIGSTDKNGKYAGEDANASSRMYKEEQRLKEVNAGKLANTHPTVKPVALMSYLIKLITPVGGTVLDLFNGSGSTGMAAKECGFDYIGIEMDPEYCKISEARIEAWNNKEEKPKSNQLSITDDMTGLVY